MTERTRRRMASVVVAALVVASGIVTERGAAAKTRPMVFAYQTARVFVIPDLEAFQTWVTARSGPVRSKALLQALALSQGSTFLFKSLRLAKPANSADRRAALLLSHLARDAGSLGAFVNRWVADLQQTQGPPKPIPQQILVQLGAVYRDARTAWISLMAMAASIGVH